MTLADGKDAEGSGISSRDANRGLELGDPIAYGASGMDDDDALELGNMFSITLFQEDLGNVPFRRTLD